jgi:type I restriction enzyme S subunit
MSDLQMFLSLQIVNKQQAIVDFIASQTERFERLTSDTRDFIALLQECRSALISAAVTGQIDVRGLVPEAVAS